MTTARYIGMDATTGASIADMDHIRQSIEKILTTPRGSRVMRRNFGSIIPDLVDRPLNDKTRMQLIAASVIAIAEWEPRIELRQVLLSLTGGMVVLTIDAMRKDGPAAGQSSNYPIIVRKG